MIRSSFIEGHHFLLARRRGYDRDEVDAVMKRLIATLRMYEEREGGAGASKISVLEAARRARAESEVPVLESEAAQQHAIAEVSEARQQAAEILTEARDEADRILQNARADSASIVARRNERSEALVTAALSEVKSLRSRALKEINDYQGSKQSEAESLLQTAELTAEDLVEEARHEAGTILGRARREHTALERRLAQLRSAIAGIEGQFRTLAESTLEQTEIVASMISLETDNLEEAIEEREPEVVRLTQPGMTIDLTDESQETEPEAKNEAHGDDSRFVVAPGSTIYQRRGGGIRSRLEDEDSESSSDE